MRIKLKTARWSGPDFSYTYGQWVDVTPEVARQLVDSKQAEAVDPFPAPAPVKKAEPKKVEPVKAAPKKTDKEV